VSPQKAPYLPLPKLREIAAAFLAGHHPENTLPVPIEDIIDTKLQIDIVPLELSVHEIESFTSHDMTTIYVDIKTYKAENTNRYRYSLAHEIAHIHLHKDIFQNAAFRDVTGWKEFTMSFGEDYRWIEWQAYEFAGLILVPPQHLEDQYYAFSKALEKAGVDIRRIGPNELRAVAKRMGDKFGVSSAVINRRAVRDGLWNEGDMSIH
jgi:hypothetical protein